MFGSLQEIKMFDQWKQDKYFIKRKPMVIICDFGIPGIDHMKFHPAPGILFQLVDASSSLLGERNL